MKRFYKLLLTSISIVLPFVLLAQPTDNVVAYYPFNGNANDVSGNNKNGTVSGATLTTDRLGKANAAYYFNGSSNQIYLPNNLLPAATAFSFGCWIKASGNNFSPDSYDIQLIIDLRGQYQIALNYREPRNSSYPNSVYYNIYDGSVSKNLFSPTNSIMPGTWYHVFCSLGNGSMELYVNGVLMGSETIGTPGNVYGYNNTIGKDYTSQNRLWFYGAIDQVLLYSRKLTSSEVQAIYNRESTSSEISELYAPVSIRYNYDASGNRSSRAPITLKSGSFINVRDSIGSESFSENYLEPQKEEIEGGKINIYPNPTRGFLKVEITGIKDEVKTSIQIYNLSGSQLVNIVPGSSTSVIDMSKYPNGTYLLKVFVGDKMTEWKIIKE